MADYASQLPGPSADRRRKALPARSTTRARCCVAGSILSPSWVAKVVPLENRAGVAEVSSFARAGHHDCAQVHGARMFKGDDEEAIANVLLLKALPEAELL